MMARHHERIPDFFIIGAPKCGTTALAEYLREHPNVFFSDPKEPFFWCDDLPGVRSLAGVRFLEDYLALFSRARPEHKAVGEGSTLYLMSEVAVAKILEAYPDAKMIAMVREPVDLALSFYLQMLRFLHEDLPDIAQAWEAQESRARGLRVPRHARAPELLQYRQVASLGTQLERFVSLVPADQRMIIELDNLAADPGRVYSEVLAFLDVPHDGRDDFPRVNEASLPRWSPLTLLLQSRSAERLGKTLKRRLPGALSRLAKRTKHNAMYAPIEGEQGSDPRLSSEAAWLYESLAEESDRMRAVLARLNDTPLGESETETT